MKAKETTERNVVESVILLRERERGRRESVRERDTNYNTTTDPRSIQIHTASRNPDLFPITNPTPPPPPPQTPLFYDRVQVSSQIESSQASLYRQSSS